MRYAVVKRWKDNKINFQILEYFATLEEADYFILKYKKSKLYELEVMKFV